MATSTRVSAVWRRRSLLGGLFAAGLLAASTPVATADQAACGQVISANTTLSGDITGCLGDGLVIGADGITIDLNGHSIDGVGLGVGVRNDGHDDVTVRNGTVREFDYGIQLNPGTARNTVADLSLVLNEWAAIRLDDADASQLRRTRITEFSDIGVHLMNGSAGNLIHGNQWEGGNGESLVVEGSPSNRIEANSLNITSDTAVRVDSSDDTTVIANRIDGAGDAALRVSASRGTSVVSNEIAGSADTAVALEASPASFVRANNVTMAGDVSVLLTDSSGSSVRENTLALSADAGILLSGVGASVIRSNLVMNSGDTAIALRDGSHGNHVVSNRMESSSDAGLFVGGNSNFVRGNVSVANTIGIEVDSGQGNRLEFNTADTNLDHGIELGESPGNTLLGNTAHGNLGGGIYVDDASVGNSLIGNAANGNDGDGIGVHAGMTPQESPIGAVGSMVQSNLARDNRGWGIYAVPTTTDGGANGASGNAEAAQCYLILCNDGSGWQPPPHPPELPDPPVPSGPPGGWESDPGDSAGGGGASFASGAPGRGSRRGRSGRYGASAGGRRGVRGPIVRCARRRGRVMCVVRYRAGRKSRRVSGRLMRGNRVVASGSRRVNRRRGRLALRARHRPARGAYQLRLAFYGARGKTAEVRRVVRVR